MASNRIDVDIGGRRSLGQRVLGTFFRGYNRRLEQAIDEGSKNGIYDVLDEWKRESVDLAPLKFGTLRRGIKAELISRGNETLTGQITATAVESNAGGRFDYAAYIHDVFPQKHGDSFKNPTTPGTIPRFIDVPLEENGAKWAAAIEREIQNTLRRRGFRGR
jgi:hypothetical protein